MYWPLQPARILQQTHSNEISALVSNRKGTLFATLTAKAVVIWSVRPSVQLAAVNRTPGSLSKYGSNSCLRWAHDGHTILILTSGSYVLTYNIYNTGAPAYSHVDSATFPAGAGEGEAMSGVFLENAGVARIRASAKTLTAHSKHIMLSTTDGTILKVPYPMPEDLLYLPQSGRFNLPDASFTAALDEDGEDQVNVGKWAVGDMEWLGEGAAIESLEYSRSMGAYCLITTDGRGYIMQPRQTSSKMRSSLSNESNGSQPAPLITPLLSTSEPERTPMSEYVGRLVHPLTRGPRPKESSASALGFVEGEDRSKPALISTEAAVKMAVNPKFGLVAIGTKSGIVELVSLLAYPLPGKRCHTLDLASAVDRSAHTGHVLSMAWTSDGYALAVGYEHGWAVWSVGGRLGGWGLTSLSDTSTSSAEHHRGADEYMSGVSDLFWSPGNLELFMMSRNVGSESNHRIFVLPFAKSASTTQPSPDNSRYALLQLDDRVLVYRGADQPGADVINPSSDVWQPIKIPPMYISSSWPIRYSAISSDGKLVAVAGRYGLTHHSTGSGRWKMFTDVREERAFNVRGGLLWYNHVLIAAVEWDHGFQIRLYSRDAELSDSHLIYGENIPAAVLLMSLQDNSLLVYTADNTLYHYLILPSKDGLRLNVCGSINFGGVVAMPTRVRAMSWMIPDAQKKLGTPTDDLIVATIIFLVDTRLVLLRPRRAGTDEVRYDMQILADSIESYWTHLSGIATLENSLWGYDGRSVRVWLDALTVEATTVNDESDHYETVGESVKFELDFYPLSILMDKGIIIGVDHEASTRRALPFTMFKILSSAQLFLPALLKHHLDKFDIISAVSLASHYQSLTYFAHALEILLHGVLEDEADAEAEGTEITVAERGTVKEDILPAVVELLDYFPQCLDVVVGAARKTEMDRWKLLFDVVGNPRELFQQCLDRKLLRTAASYLLVLHNIQPDDDSGQDTNRLLRLAIDAKDYQLVQDLLRFLKGMDETGRLLDRAIVETGIML